MYNTNQQLEDICYKEVGLRIRNRRMELGIKQSKMAEDIKMSNNHLSAVEHGNQKLSLDAFVRICSYLNVTPDYLLLGSIHSYNLPQNTLDKLKLCDPTYLDLANEFLEIMVKKSNKKDPL